MMSTAAAQEYGIIPSPVTGMMRRYPSESNVKAWIGASETKGFAELATNYREQYTFTPEGLGCADRALAGGMPLDESGYPGTCLQYVLRGRPTT